MVYYLFTFFFWYYCCLCSRHPRKRPKVNRTDVKAGSSSDRKTRPDRKTIAPVLKAEPQIPAIQYQVSDDEVEVVDDFSATPKYMCFDVRLSHDLHRIVAIPIAVCQVFTNLAFHERRQPRPRVLYLLLSEPSGKSDYIYSVVFIP